MQPALHLSRLVAHHAQELDTLSIYEMTGLLDAVETMAGVACGLVNQPKFCGPGGTTSRSGAVLDEILEDLNRLVENLTNRIIAATPKDNDEADRRARVVIRYHADGDEVRQLATIAEALSAPRN